MSVNKLILGTAVGAGVIALVSYVARMNRTSANLEVIPSVNIHSLDWNGLVLRVDAVLKNPSNGHFKVKFPYVKATYKDSLLGTSQVINKDIEIPAFGQVAVDSIMLEIGTLSFFSVGYELIKALNKKEPVALMVEILTTIDVGWSRIPYSLKKEITLKV